MPGGKPLDRSSSPSRSSRIGAGSSINAPSRPEALARHPRPVLALHAMLPEPADPTLFDRFPTGTTSLALGPGWHPHPVPTHVARIDSLAAALESITALVAARRDAEPGAAPASAQ